MSDSQDNNIVDLKSERKKRAEKPPKKLNGGSRYQQEASTGNQGVFRAKILPIIQLLILLALMALAMRQCRS